MSIVPADRIVLRYSNAIATKHDKYQGYLKTGRVSKADAYVVAVNGWPLGYSWASDELPRFIKAIYPLGALGFAIDPATRELVDRKHQFRPLINKNNRSTVSTQLFLREHYAGISAVLHSHAQAFMSQSLGSDFHLALNPLARQPLPEGLLPSRREWRAMARAGSGYELAWTDIPLSA